LEDKVGIGFPKPLLINQEGAFFFSEREEVEEMDMESDMGEGDMRRKQIPTPSMQMVLPKIEVQLPLLKPWKRDPSKQMARFR